MAGKSQENRRYAAISISSLFLRLTTGFSLLSSFMSSDFSPRRIVCLQPSATVILTKLGELERVVACTRYCAEVVPEIETSNRTILSDSWTANAEEIVAAQPDFVIASVPYQEKAVGEILKAG